MQQELLPLFPLQVVLFPRTPLPLHIFEDRYKEMMGEVIPSRAEFGIVLAANDGIVNIGCTAVVEKVLKKYPDGRLDLLAGGRRRFEIHLLNEEKSYLRGEVQFFDDEDADETPADVSRLALEGYDAVRRIETGAVTDPVMDDRQLSFQLAQAIPDLDVRQALLNSRSEVERMRQLAAFFPKLLVRQKHVSHLRQIAPTNGHAKPPGTSEW